MIRHFDQRRIETYREIAKHIGVRAVAATLNEFDVPVEIAIMILARKH